MRNPGCELSVAQISYLENIQRLQDQGEKCTVSRVASLSGVTHGPVSRFMKTCAEQGYVDDRNYLTESGKFLLKRQQTFLRNVEAFVQGLGLEGEELQKSVKNLAENVDTSLLELMMERERRRQKFDQMWGSQKGGEEVPARAVEELLLSGTHEVEFRLFRSGGEEGLSMADHGFEHPAVLKKGRDGAWLEFTRKRMQARSRKHGHMMTGQLETLRYEDRGVLKMAPMQEDALRIPVNVFQFAGEAQNEFVGKLYVTIACSVGDEHMPENTALLVIWL